MKKATILACACALVLGAQAVGAQEVAQELSYQEDPSQGVLLNRFKDNWFVTAEGGASFYLAAKSIHRNIGDRFMPAASVYVGKWFSPIIGIRIGANYMGLKGLATGADYTGAMPTEPFDGGKYFKTKYAEIGPVGDVMVNLTNWWCGYKPNRIYNATFYGGSAYYITYVKKLDGDHYKWNHACVCHHSKLALRFGLLNSFNVSKQVQLSLDLRFTPIDAIQNEGGSRWSKNYASLQGYLGVTYLFKKREWKAPVVPVCPEPENCDALRARLAAADARIADLEQQLKDCLNRPVEKVVENKGPLATLYYPIGVSRLSRESQRVVKAIAYVMTQNPDKKYILTGWADNYTGTDNINMRLRKNRAEGVQKLLVKNGVAESQLEVTTNNGNLSDLGEKCVALDRAVTIEEK